MLGHERVVGQVGIGTAGAVEFVGLTGAERLLGVEAPDALQKALPSQHLVNAGNHSRIVVGRVENCRIAVGDFDAQLQEVRW